MVRDDRANDIGRTTRRGVLASGAAAVGTAAFAGTSAAADGGGSNDELAAEETVHGATATGSPEVRAIYAMPMWYWDGDTVASSRVKMRQWLNRAKEAGINVVYAWIESDGMASLLGEPAYAESDAYDFWNPDRGWDPLGELIAGARRRGIEVHLWYSFSRYKRSSMRIPEYNPDLEVLPEGDPSWASLRKPEYERGLHHSADSGVGGQSICANAFGAHDWTIEALDRAFESYPGLRGLHIEEPGYLADDRCVCQRCRRLFADRYGTDPETLLDHTYTEIPPYYDDYAAVPIRTRGTDSFVEQLHDWWTGREGDDVLSFNGGWKAEKDQVLGRNWAEWSKEGWVPYYSPQAYAKDVDRFEAKLAETMEALADSVVAPIIYLDWSNGGADPDSVAEQVRRARSMDGHAGTDVGGAGFFSGAGLTPELAVTLRSGPYTESSSPHWHQSNDSTPLSRGDATLSDLRDQDPFAFTTHWREGPRPGEPRDSDSPRY